MDFTWKDTFFQNIENRNQYIYNNYKQVISDIETAEIDPCYYELLKALQIKSVAAFPIIINTLSSPLWGLVIIHYCH